MDSLPADFPVRESPAAPSAFLSNHLIPITLIIAAGNVEREEGEREAEEWREGRRAWRDLAWAAWRYMQQQP